MSRITHLSVACNLVTVGLVLVGYVSPNVKTTFVPQITAPEVSSTARIHPLASVIGSVSIGDRVFVAPAASIRGDEGQHIHIGHDSNVQDGVVVHGLHTFDHGKEIPEHEVEFAGKRYSVYVGERTSLAHQSQVHGPARIGHDTFVGMQALVFKSELGDHVVVEPGAKIIGVKVPPGRYVPAMSLISTQTEADALPTITADYPYNGLNEHVVHVNIQLAGASPRGAYPR